jgi:hypothetical protein
VTVLIRRSPDMTAVLVNGRVAVSVSDDDVPGDTPFTPSQIAAYVASNLARGLGLAVETEDLR